MYKPQSCCSCYPVYVHLNQVDGEVENAKCSCKAGQGGCCKHVAALLHTILDFVNLNLKYVPTELTCTQVPQRWSVPSGSSKTLEKAVKFEDLLFEKADVNKPSKRYCVKGSREDYCLKLKPQITISRVNFSRHPVVNCEKENMTTAL